MDTDNTGSWRRTLESLALITVSGEDSEAFLQGQLSNDVSALSADSPAQFSSLSTARGRVFAVLLVIRRAEHEFGLVLPQAQVQDVANRLRMFVLRSKVTLVEATAARFEGASGSLAQDILDPEQPWAARWLDDTHLAIRWPDPTPRVLLLSLDPSAETSEATDDGCWWQREISAGIPWITGEGAREEFVAQMLDLDLLQGISFEKGCYTGQEVIARTHYLGRVKRRLRRYAVDVQDVAPGAAIEAQVTDEQWQKAGSVVLASPSEVLAVLQLDHAERPLRLADTPDHAGLRPLDLPR
ncbi:MAG: hypothetical protein AAF184_04975 [Pseudomonadota bacterium]